MSRIGICLSALKGNQAGLREQADQALAQVPIQGNFITGRP